VINVHRASSSLAINHKKSSILCDAHSPRTAYFYEYVELFIMKTRHEVIQSTSQPFKEGLAF
jgi:hypothetical protein